MPADGLRERHAEDTRQAILDALIALIREQGVHAFSIQAVADRAGISHRTVYRYFPTREALLEALGEWSRQFMAEKVQWTGPGYPEVVPEQLSDLTVAAWETFDEHPEVASTYVALAATEVLPARVERSAWFERLLAPRTAHLAPADAKAVSLLIRSLSSSTVWHHVHRHGNAKPAAMRAAVRWAIDVLVRELAAGKGPNQGRRRASTPEEA